MRGREQSAIPVVLSCEHASAAVPARYAALFAGREDVLASHRGWDPGALALARDLARALDAPLFAGRATRLLVDLNRSLDHPRLHSRFTRAMGARELRRLIDEHHGPHRRAVEEAVRRSAARGRLVLHLSVHSFTPVLDRRSRHVDVGLLYDPRRERERALAAAWRAAILSRAPRLRVRRNEPYRGWTDGLTTALRGRFSARAYLGLELEISQGLLDERSRPLPAVARSLIEGLCEALRSAGPRAVYPRRPRR